MARPPGRGRGRGAGSGREVSRSPSRQSEPEDRGRMERLEAQLAALAGMVQHLVQQQAAAAAPPVAPPAAPSVIPPIAPPVVEPEGPVDPPVDPAPPPAGLAPGVPVTSKAVPGVAAAPTATASTASASSRSVAPAADPAADVEANRAEKARAKAVLLEFKKFKPQIFVGKDDDHWAVEEWIDHMEKLFQDAYTEDRDKVHIAVHCLEGRASKWWRRHRERYFPSPADPTWEDFKAAMYHHHLKETTKEGLERELENIKQGDKSVREYEQEFLRIADLVPQAVREERRKVRLFSQGLRQEIRRQISSHLAADFDNCVERCLAIEAEIQISRAEREATERRKDKKRTSSGSKVESSNSGKPPKYPRSQDQTGSASASNQQRGLRPCIFCGRPHYANTCPRRHGRCYGCGQPGHIRENCPQRITPDYSTAPAPVIPYQRQGTSSSAASSGRPPLPRPSEGARQPSGGRVYALTPHGEPAEENPTTDFVALE